MPLCLCSCNQISGRCGSKLNSVQRFPSQSTYRAAWTEATLISACTSRGKLQQHGTHSKQQQREESSRESCCGFNFSVQGHWRAPPVMALGGIPSNCRRIKPMMKIIIFLQYSSEFFDLEIKTNALHTNE